MQTKNSNFRSCEAVEQSFDSLPLMHYIDDEPLDIIGMNTNMPNNNIYSHISRLFYGLCPKLSNLEFLYLPLPHPHNHNEKKKRKKRIGIVSSKLVNHDVLKLHGGLLSHLSNAENRNDFELFVACYPTPVDSTTSRIQRTILSGGGSPINLVGPPGSDDAARRLQNAELDVIVYLDVNIDPRTFALAHRRIARVQVALWGGWTYTSGVSDAVDYFLVPDAMLPVGEEALNSEQVVRFDGLYTGEMFGGNSKGYTGRSENSPYSNRTKLLETFMIDKEACIINVPASAVKFHPEFDSYLKGILKVSVKESGAKRSAKPLPGRCTALWLASLTVVARFAHGCGSPTTTTELTTFIYVRHRPRRPASCSSARGKKPSAPESPPSTPSSPTTSSSTETAAKFGLRSSRSE